MKQNQINPSEKREALSELTANEEKFVTILTDLKSIELAADEAIADNVTTNGLHGEAEDMTAAFHTAATSIAHIGAPGDMERSNELLERSGYEDLTEESM